jgi:two-component system, LuxR family, sensor kinase FixL
MALSRLYAFPRPMIGLAYLVTYVLLDWISFIHPFAAFGITPWNPPTGASFIVALLFGQRFIPLLFVAPLLADLMVRHLPFPWTVEIATTLVVGGGYALGTLQLLRVNTRFNPTLTSMRDLMVLMVVAAGSAALVASGYIAVLLVAGLVTWSDIPAALTQFWVGDMIGIAVVAPFALILLTRGYQIASFFEMAAQIAAILLTLGLVFVFGTSNHFQLFYLLFLPVVWMAVRGGLERVTIGLLIAQIGLVLGVQLLPPVEINVTAFQALMLVLTLTGLTAGAVVTEHRRGEFQVRRHQDSLSRLAQLGSMGRLAAAIAHEINQPLMAAGTYSRLVADALRGGGHDVAETAEMARKAVAQVERAAEVVRRLRALMRLDRSGRAPVPVERIFRETVDLCRPDLDRNGVTLKTILEGDLPLVMVDLLQIEQVLLNLVRNAIEAMSSIGHGGIITLRASRTEVSSVSVEVRDTGPGFPPGYVLSEVPLFASAKPEGLGVGLPLSQAIVASHGGRLIIGGGREGAIVTFTLPQASTKDD